jgi:hypothetical protein
MTMRTALIVLLVGLVATSAWAQARTAPPADGPKPAMIVAGRALTPAAWAEGLQGDTVELDGVDMIWIGAAARAAGGSAMITTGPEGRILNVRAGTRSTDFVILPPGEFWRDPWVRYLIAQADVYELQPLPWWPYEEANIPTTPPHAVNWKRPYLDWKPDEAWLLLNLMPPPPPAEEVIVIIEDDDEEEEEEAEEAAAPAPAPAPAPGMDPGMDPAMMDPGMMPPGAEPPPVP